VASDEEFVDYVVEQMAGAGAISRRKMFGEYAVYCDGKVVALVCDNEVFVKPTAPAQIRHLLCGPRRRRPRLGKETSGWARRRGRVTSSTQTCSSTPPTRGIQSRIPE